MESRNSTTLMAVVTACLLTACGSSDDNGAPAPVAVGDTILLTASGKIASINRASPGTLIGSIPVSGLTSGETLVGIDHRPADGLLYGLGSAGRLYTVVPATGAATLKSTLRAAAGDDNPFAALTGTDFAVDFNPVADRLRVISNTGQNLRINVDTGDTITDGAITATSGQASVTAAAYTNSFAGTTGTALFDIDSTSGLLHLQDPPNNGTLAAGVPLGAVPSSINGFDIDARTNVGYAVFTSGSGATLFSVNPAATSNAATRVGDIPSAEPIRGIALVQPAVPKVIGLTGDNRLVTFDPRTPNALTAAVPIAGLAAGERIIGIDVRPADRRVYALSATGRLYQLDSTTGVATATTTLTPDATDATAPFTGLTGTTFSVDFNPVADRMRVISDSGQNLRINVDTGAVITDGTINRSGTAPSVLAAAYTNSFAGPASTVLYDLEGNSDVLARQDPPNNGTLVDVGSIGFDLGSSAAFDIAGGSNGLALAALRASGSSALSLYGVSLTTGVATPVRTGDPALSLIGGASGPALIDIAIIL